MNRETPVGEVMTTDVVTVAPDMNVEAAMRLLLDRDVDAAPVVGDGGRVVGMLTTGDLIVQESQLHFPTVLSVLGGILTLPSQQGHFEDDLRRALGGTVAEVMNDEPVTCGEHDTVERAATLMHDHDVSRLPVLRDGALVGIVSRSDILRAILASE